MLFLLSSAEFVAAAQVLVYAGAVMVMFLFVIAYLGGRADAPWAGGPPLLRTARSSPRRRSSSRSSSCSGWPGATTSPTRPQVSGSFGSPAEIGELFLTDHLLAFEITSIVLLVAAVGGVVLGTTREKEESRVMDGPDVGWYLIVAAILFAIGAMGVMLRRSPLIVLLSLEIMLNAANLALVAFSRQYGDARRPDLRARRDGGRRRRGRGRPRADRRDGAARIALDVDQASALRG